LRVQVVRAVIASTLAVVTAAVTAVVNSTLTAVGVTLVTICFDGSHFGYYDSCYRSTYAKSVSDSYGAVVWYLWLLL
jgi:hypothetical protein